jgi:hypothetical protein
VLVCIETGTEPLKLPPLGVNVGVATVEGGLATVNANVVVLLIPPPLAVTVTGKLPLGAEVAV